MIKIYERIEEEEEKCIQQARKKIQHERKWGRWSGYFYLVISVVYFILSILFARFVLWFIIPIINPPNQNPQQIDLVKGAMAGGMLLGFISGFVLFKGIWFLIESIKSFKGDRTSHLLVEYHDALIALVHNQTDQEVDVPDSDIAPI